MLWESEWVYKQVDEQRSSRLEVGRGKSEARRLDIIKREFDRKAGHKELNNTKPFQLLISPLIEDLLNIKSNS